MNWKRCASYLLTASLAMLSIIGLQAAEVNPAQGYTQSQALNFFSKFEVSNWNADGNADASRYYYLNTSQFFRHALIHRAGQISDLGSAPNASIGKVRAETYAGDMSFDEWVQGHLDGAIVVHNGVIVYEEYPRMRPTDKHIWWSVSKSVAGTLVGIMEAKGLVDVNKPIESYIPQLKDSDWQGTPIIDVLDMASGMTGMEADDPEAYTNPESAYGLFESSLGIQPATPNTMASTYDYIATLKRQKPSGRKAEYTSVNTFVLAWLVEEVTGKSYAEAVSELLWKSIGAESDALMIVSPIGAPGAHGLISSGLRDLARYGLLYTPSWKKVSEEQVIPDSLIKKIQEGGRPEVYKGSLSEQVWDYYAGEPCVFQTRQFDFVTSDGDFAKSGFHGQTLYISPEKDLVVASFATNEKYDTFKFARAIAKSLREKPPTDQN